MSATGAAPITIAAASLLISARAGYTGEPFTQLAIEALLHPMLRYSHSGPDSVIVTALDAWEELQALGHITGNVASWTPSMAATGGVR